jgi:hypothetical protein
MRARPFVLSLALAAAPALVVPALAHAEGFKKGSDKIEKAESDAKTLKAPPVETARSPLSGWKKLGERTVDGKNDKDVIAVGAEDGVFTAVTVKVEDSSLLMHEIKITFANGETFEPKTKLVFEKDSTTRVIDLPGEKRIIKKVEFKYGNLPGGGKAKVELWGKGAGAVAPPPVVLTGWKRLGEREVNGKLDKDTIMVGADDGLFTAIGVKVEDSALLMHEIKITFANGETYEPKTKLVFEKDSTTRVIDLPGEKRFIKKVEFKYGNLPGGGKAKVELWGKQAIPPAVKLGEREVNGKLDKDVIVVGAEDGTFTGIQVKVEGSGLVMHEIKVTFANGETFEPKTKLVFDKDTSTRMIDLPGNKRIIKKVEFKYGNLPGGGKARVELWGKR